MRNQLQHLARRTPIAAHARLDLHVRAARTYQTATRDLAQTPPTFRKARALSQGPSRFEKVMVEILKLYALGATTTALRGFELELRALIHDLEAPGSETLAEDLLRAAQAQENIGNTAEVEAALAHLAAPRELDQLAEAYEREALIKTEAAAAFRRRAREIAARPRHLVIT